MAMLVDVGEAEQVSVELIKACLSLILAVVAG
jgi:hypothetical protein